MAFVEDFTEFFDSDEFAVNVKFQNKEFTGIFDEIFNDQVGLEGSNPSVLVSEAIIDGAKRGDSFVIVWNNPETGAKIEQREYALRYIERDGTGLARVYFDA